MLRLEAKLITSKILDGIPFDAPPNSFDPIYENILTALEDAYLCGRKDQCNKVAFACDDNNHLVRTFEEVG